MYPAPFEYVRPRDLDPALRLYADGGGEAKLLAGGASLVPLMKLRLATPASVIDIGQLSALAGESQRDGHLVFGALTRHGAIERSAAVRAKHPLLRDVASQIGDPQIRNMGTIGGGLAEADPAGDWGTGLLAADATVTLASVRGRRQVAATDLFLDAYTTALEADEVIVEVAVPLPGARSGGAHLKLERRVGDFAVANCAVQLTLDGAGAYAEIRVALGGVALRPFRAGKAEALLRGRRPDEEVLRAAADAVRSSTESFSDLRGSAAYRTHVAGVLFRRALDIAQRRAAGEEVDIHHG